MSAKLRLLLFEECRQQCAGCCNKQWNLAALPICRDYMPYEAVLLTGGEPMLYPEVVLQAVREIRAQTAAPIYVYTADVGNTAWVRDILSVVDGMTVALHARADVANWVRLALALHAYGFPPRSLRLNVFRGVTVDCATARAWGWVVKSNIEWLDPCPLPPGEVFMRYKSSKQTAGV